MSREEDGGTVVPFPSRTLEVLAEIEAEGHQLYRHDLRAAWGRAFEAEERAEAAERLASKLALEVEEWTDRARLWSFVAFGLPWLAFGLGVVIGLWGRL